MISNRELLPKYVWDSYGDNGMRFLDTRIVACIKYLRNVLAKPININNSQFDSRTLRTQSSQNYSTFSCHSFGRAIDFDVEGMDSLAVQRFITKDIVASTELKKLGLTGIEDGTPSWTHITCSNLDGWGFQEINGIKLVPKP